MMRAHVPVVLLIHFQKLLTALMLLVAEVKLGRGVDK